MNFEFSILNRDSQLKIIDLVCEWFNVSKEDVLGKSRRTEYVLPRHISMYLLYQYFGLNKSLVGRIFQTKHTTVIAAIKTIEREKLTYSSLSNTIEFLRKEIEKSYANQAPK